MRAVIYSRLSVVRDPERGALSLADQEERCAQAARARGWEVIETFREPDVTASSEDVWRPEFERMSQRVLDGAAEVVVCWALDRLFRRLTEAVSMLDAWRKAGGAVVVVSQGIDTTTEYGEVLYALFAALAQVEARTRQDRSLRFHQRRAEMGLPIGGGTRPFGFEPDGETHRDSEAQLIREAVASLLQGGSLRAIVRDWNARGIKTPGSKRAPSGNPWSKTSVRRLLLSPRIAGLRQHRREGVTYGASWSPIISEEDHLRLRARFSGTREVTGRRYLLTGGLAVCGLCGARLVARPKGDGRRCYVCATDGGGCGKIRCLALPLEEAVAQIADAIHRDRALERPAPRRDEGKEVRSELEADTGSLEELARERFVTRSLTNAEFKAAREPLVQRIEAAQARLATIERGSARRQLFETLDEVEVPPWEQKDPDATEVDAWRAWIAEVVDRVTVGPAVRGRNQFDPDRVAVEPRLT
jgi:DNA invertase Pin-like site-specific DNA recombinase